MPERSDSLLVSSKSHDPGIKLNYSFDDGGFHARRRNLEHEDPISLHAELERLTPA